MNRGWTAAIGDVSSNLKHGKGLSPRCSQSMESHLNSQPPPLHVPLPTNFSQSQMTQPENLEDKKINLMGTGIPQFNESRSSPQSWVSNTQQSTINSGSSAAVGGSLQTKFCEWD